MFSKNFVRKANQFRKQNWSAPTVMSVFIIICMIIIFSMESLGLSNKERNLQFRHVTPERIIKTAAEQTQNKQKDSSIVNMESENARIAKLKNITQKSKEEHYEQMMRILMEGATEQLKYQGIHFNEDQILENEVELFDF
jgi:hypothetical protein